MINIHRISEVRERNPNFVALSSRPGYWDGFRASLHAPEPQQAEQQPEPHSARPAWLDEVRHG